MRSAFREIIRPLQTLPAFTLRLLALVAALQIVGSGNVLWACEDAICGIQSCCCQNGNERDAHAPHAAEFSHSAAALCDSDGAGCHCEKLESSDAARASDSPHFSAPAAAWSTPGLIAFIFPPSQSPVFARESRGPPFPDPHLRADSSRAPPLS